jgi:hypothetical protein
MTTKISILAIDPGEGQLSGLGRWGGRQPPHLPRSAPSGRIGRVWMLPVWQA